MGTHSAKEDNDA